MALDCLGSSQAWMEVNLRLSSVFDGLFMMDEMPASVDQPDWGIGRFPEAMRPSSRWKHRQPFI